MLKTCVSLVWSDDQSLMRSTLLRYEMESLSLIEEEIFKNLCGSQRRSRGGGYDARRKDGRSELLLKHRRLTKKAQNDRDYDPPLFHRAAGSSSSGVSIIFHSSPTTYHTLFIPTSLAGSTIQRALSFFLRFR